MTQDARDALAIIEYNQPIHESRFYDAVIDVLLSNKRITRDDKGYLRVTKKESRLKVVNHVAKTGKSARVDGLIVDAYTANMIISKYTSMSTVDRIEFSKFTVDQMVTASDSEAKNASIHHTYDAISAIAKRFLNISDLESEDKKIVSIRKALESAYQAGVDSRDEY